MVTYEQHKNSSNVCHTHHVLPESLIQKAFMPRQRKSLSEIAFLEELDNGLSANIKDKD